MVEEQISFEIAALFPPPIRWMKSAANSKLICSSTNWSRYYIVLALSHLTVNNWTKGKASVMTKDDTVENAIVESDLGDLYNFTTVSSWNQGTLHNANLIKFSSVERHQLRLYSNRISLFAEKLPVMLGSIVRFCYLLNLDVLLVSLSIIDCVWQIHYFKGYVFYW